MKRQRETHYDRVLRHLKDFKGITSWQAFEWYGITRLSAIIFELRNDGYNIESETLKMKNRYGDPVHFAKYVLKGEINEN